MPAAKMATFNIKSTDDLCVRQTPTATGAWQPLGEIETVELSGLDVPTRRFKKDVIGVGNYVKVEQSLAFNVTPQVLTNWVLQFKRMRENGVKVSVPDTHANAGIASKNMGWVDNMWVEGETLWMSCKLIGKDALAAAARGDVSLYAPPSFDDGKGNQYARPITHVALCTDPLVPGLGDFIPLAASLAMQPQGDNTMDPIVTLLQQLGQAVGLNPADIVDAESGTKLLLAKLEELVKGTAGDADANAVPVPASDGTVKPGDVPAGTPRKQVVTTEFSQGKDSKPNAITVGLVVENRSMHIQRLVDTKKIVPAVADQLRKQWTKPEAISLALSAGSDGEDFKAVVAAFEANAPVYGSEKTGAQSFSLADPNKAKPREPSAIEKDALDRKKAATAAA